MKINTNHWNKIRYTFYTPIYNVISTLFRNSRLKSIQSLNLKENDKVLLVGAGTGLDLPYLPEYCKIVATDITPSMIAYIDRNSKNKNLKTMVMDGQVLTFPDHTFDAIILHLILAVIPDPIACILECERVLKPNGAIVVFDKFVPSNKEITLLRKFVNIFSSFLFSDITRNFESILSQTQLTLASDLPADFNGNFRLIKLTKK